MSGNLIHAMKKRRWGRTLLRRDALLALALLAITLAIHEIFGNHGLLALRRQKRAVDSLEQEIQQVRKENQQLEQRIKALKTDPRAIEQLAREQMKLARPGEVIFTLPEDGAPPEPPAPPTDSKTNR